MIYYFITLGLRGTALLAFFLAYVLAIIIATTLHELSHAFVAYKLGDPTPKMQGRLTLNPIKSIDPWGAICFLAVGFGWAKPVETNPLNYRNYNRGRRLVSLAGITTNLILGIIFSCLAYFFSPYLLASSNVFLVFVGYFLEICMAINFALAVFNLIPIYPLDGFKFIETFMKPDNKFANFMRKYGSIIMFIFIVSPVFDMIYYYAYGGLQTVVNLFWGLF